jgi:iron complex transport system substrate-binding protein
MRLITTTCSNTEIVHALGCGHMIIATDDYSDYPPELVADLPRVGPDLSIDAKRVSSLNPDLVLASDTVPGHDKVIESLQAEGLNVFAPRTIGLDDVYRDIADIAELLGVRARGDALIEQMRNTMIDRGTRHGAPSIMVQWWPKPIIAAARDSWIHDLINLAGGRDAMADVEARSQPLADDDPLLTQADTWVISWCGVKPEKYRPQVLYDRDTLQSCRAIQDRQLYCVAEAYLGRPSPRLIDGYRELCAIVDQFSER